VSAHPRTLVILNPEASSGKGRALEPRVRAWLQARDIPFTLHLTRRPGHARDLAADAARQGTARIAVVGGDGTIHEVANGLLNGDAPPPPIAVVPVGTGNDFFRMVGASRKPEDALQALERGVPRMFDVGHVRFDGGESYFVNLLGVGIDVEVLAGRERFRRLKGLPQYLAAFASAMVSYSPPVYRVAIGAASDPGGSEVFEERTILMVMTVGPSIGGGFMVNPEASPLDGRLNLFFVGNLGLVKIARYVPKVIRGTHGGTTDIQLRTFGEGRVELGNGQPFRFELDGEGMPDPVTYLDIECCAGRLPVLRLEEP